MVFGYAQQQQQSATNNDHVKTSSMTGASAHRAPSVSSTRSGTRRHRHARSHHGGTSSHLAQNEFPVFSATGDVEIIITNPSGRKEQRYLLHRLILSQYSGFFEASTRDAWNRQGDDRAGNLAPIGENSVAGSSSRTSSQDRSGSFDQARKRWKYVLDWQSAGEEDTPMLIQDSAQKPSMFGGDSFSYAYQQDHRRNVGSMSTLSLSDRSAQPQRQESGDEILKDYDNLFRTMYQFTPMLDNLNIATAYTECKALLHLADMYDALEIVGSRVDHHLLRFGARLFKQIAKYPPSYLKLGYLARSRTIFTESLIHVVGQWPLASPQLRQHLDAGVLDLILDKYDDLEDMKARVEGKLWRLNLTNSRGERITPHNDYLSWLAISLFRQWLAECTTPAPPSILKDADALPNGRPPQHNRAGSRGSINHVASQRMPPPQQAVLPINMGKVYLLIGSTVSTSYLGHEELKRFLKAQPDLYTRDNLRRFERRMEEVKNIARDAVRPLMRNFLELDLSAFGPAGLGYLTCTRLEDADLPWDE